MPLTAEAVVEGGVALVRAQGWDALSVRALAGRLGVTPMALYRHIDDGPRLQHAVIRAIARELAVPFRGPDPFADLAEWARQARAGLRAYPGVAAQLLMTWFEVPEALAAIDDLLAVAMDAGLDGFDAVAAVNAVFTFVLMRCEAERAIRDAGAMRRALAGGATARPLRHLPALIDHYTTAEVDRHFEYGLAALVAGIRAGAP